MSKFMSNSDVMQLFETVDGIRQSELDEANKNKKINAIHTKIVEGLVFLVYSHAKRYRKFPNYEDLVQEGMIGLLKAVRKFNYKLFPNFFIYSERWIRHAIKKSASHFDIVYSPNRNRVVYSDSPESLIKEEEMVDSPEEEYFELEKTYKIREVLEEFSEREQKIVEKIFGLIDNSPQTLREIGPTCNITYERVRQIKNQVIEKLKKNESLIDYTNI